MSTLEFRDVSIRYAVREGSSRTEVDAVKDVSLTLERGATLGLAGESGSGKSTLAMSVLRLLPKSAKISGSICLNGKSITELKWGQLRAVRWTGASIIFQGAMHALNPVQRVNRQIEEALELHPRAGERDYSAPEERKKRVRELLEQVDLTPEKGQCFPHELSGGQKQRIMIAMALACDPDLIIADEPTTALDVIVQDQVLQLLKEKIEAYGLTLLMISHDLSVLAATCDEIAVMKNGEIVEMGDSLQVMTEPKHPYTAKLAAAFPVIGDENSRLSLPAYTSPMAPLQVDIPPNTEELKTQFGPETSLLNLENVVLSAQNLTVKFGRGPSANTAVNRVDLTCRPGEIIALVGQSGSGKTTLARTLLGLQAPTDGTVYYRGEPMPKSRRKLRSYRRHVQYVLQDPMSALNHRHTVYEQIAEGIRAQKLDGDEHAIVCEALEHAGLSPADEYLHAYPTELSGGQRQRVVIAGALALNPEYLIADEPVASLDASVRGEVLALFLKLRTEMNLGALIITHDLGLAWNIADRVAVMYQGEIVEHGPVEEILLNPTHSYTKKLLDAAPSRARAHSETDQRRKARHGATN